jgi:hypothetical protein
MLRESAVELLIACEDNIEYSSHILIRVADARKIPTVIVPFTITNATEAAEFYFNCPENIVSSNFINRLVARIFPHWVYTHRDRKLLRLPVERILVLEMSGLAPARPWMLNSGTDRRVAVESQRMLQHYLEEGLSAEQLVVTGALSDDVLFDAVCAADKKRKKLFDDLDLQQGRPLLLCSFPPNQFPRECGFASYEALVSFWMESLSRLERWNVVIRPHPRMRDHEINIVRSFGIPVTALDTASLVPLCNLYLASVSATIRWAIACGIPVINYDVYRMRYKDYTEVEGVLIVEEQQSLLQTLALLTNDKEYYERIEAAQKKEMHNWGMLDGKSGERMLQLFEQVAVKNIRRI